MVSVPGNGHRILLRVGPLSDRLGWSLGCAHGGRGSFGGGGPGAPPIVVQSLCSEHDKVTALQAEGSFTQILYANSAQVDIIVLAVDTVVDVVFALHLHVILGHLFEP